MTCPRLSNTIEFRSQFKHPNLGNTPYPKMVSYVCSISMSNSNCSWRVGFHDTVLFTHQKRKLPYARRTLHVVYRSHGTQRCQKISKIRPISVYFCIQSIRRLIWPCPSRVIMFGMKNETGLERC